MATAETNILKSIMFAVSGFGCKMFRNNVAKAWIGQATVIKKRGTVTVEPGDVVVRQGRRLHAGLQKGSGDLIGWTPVTVTSEMVGKQLAVFTSIEVKTSTGRASKDQINWGAIVHAEGGISGICRSDTEAVKLVTKHK